MFRKTALLVLVSIASFAGAIYFADIREIVAGMAEVEAGALLACAAFIACNNLLACIRFGSLLKGFGLRPSWRDLFAAFSLGQISNQFLLSVFGQSLTRAMLLSRVGVPSSAAIVVTYFERVLAAAVLLFLSVGATWYLLRVLTIDLDRGAALALSVGSMIVVGLIVVASVFRESIVRAMRERGMRWTRRLIPAVAMTLLAHVAMLCAYLSILESFEEVRFSLSLVAALTIVMFTTSLPISFSGWGIRELSAAAALTLVGVPPAMAVAVAVAVGVLSLVVMFMFGGLGLLLMGKRSAPPAAVQGSSRMLVKWDSLILQGCAFFCAVLLFFQLRIPLQKGELTVAMSDIPAVIGGSIVALLLVTRRMALPFQPFLAWALAAMSGLIVYGLASAALQGGLGHWALFNRGLGWVVLLGYASTAAAAVSVAGEAGRTLILRSFIVAGLAVCGAQVVLMLADAVIALPKDVFNMPLKGYVENQNAFSFQLAMVGVLLIVALARGIMVAKRPAFVIACLFVTVIFYYAKSRTGLVFVGLLAIAMYVLSRRAAFFDDGARQQLRGAAILSVTLVLLLVCLPYIAFGAIYAGSHAYAWTMETLYAATGGMIGRPVVIEVPPFAYYNSVVTLGVRLTHDTSEAERWETISQGLDMWRAHPIFGAGLGSYVDWRMALTGKMQVIHSIPVWLLAELGLLGAVVSIGVFVGLLWRGWRMLRLENDFAWGLGLIGILVPMAAGGMVHDILYQRMFWFLLGLFCVALPRAPTGIGRAT